MNQLMIFIKKEFIESIKTKRFLIAEIIFVLFGLMNPLLAKLMPKIIGSALPKGVSAAIPAPTSLDSWTQFFKNMTQLGLIILVILFCDIVSHELANGYLINFLTKGLSRWVVVLSKQLLVWFVWTISLITTFLVTVGYTNYYFNDHLSRHLFPAVFALWLFGLLLMTVVVTGSTVSASGMKGLLITGGFYALGMFSTVFTGFKKINPFSLINQNMQFLQGKQSFGEYGVALAITVILMLIGLAISLILFNRKRV
ncbi:ABC transporter permease subunit [Lentilactobacillus hilgardii]|uniref:ABC transporter permease subunit n=1 Tax=Lentilactobacillus hilgardii TaxID=1588 RepID=UPI003FA5FDDD